MEGETRSDLAAYGWGNVEPQPKRSSTGKRKRRPSVAPETAAHMSIPPRVVEAYVELHGCAWDEAEARLRRSVRGVLKSGTPLRRGARDNQWRFSSFGPGGAPRYITTFTARSIEWYGLAR